MHGRTPQHRSSPVATLDEGELLRLGEWVRDVSFNLISGSYTLLVKPNCHQASWEPLSRYYTYAGALILAEGSSQ